MKSIKVVAAVIRDGDKVFATERGYGEFKDMWEFPGGKVERGEDEREALCREIKEELSAEIAVDKYITTVECDYPSFHISISFYFCHVVSGSLILLEHENAMWLDLDNLSSLSWLEADRKALVAIRESL